MPAADKRPPVELVGIKKSFGGVRALSDVSFAAAAGQVTCLVGENGAGKSTLLKIMSGVIEADEGEIRLNGRAASLPSPAAAQKAGIAIIHQELNVLPDLSIAENIYLSRLPVRGPTLDWNRLFSDTHELLTRLQIKLDPRRRVGTLSLARQQMVEIARAIAQRATIIAMDEPTATLSEDDVNRLIALMEQLKRDGVAVIFVSHRLNEVMRVGDRITVLRDGAAVATMARAEATPERVVELMVGRSIDQQFPKEPTERGDVVLEIRDLSTRELLRGVSLSVRRGEIVGLAGLVGAGRTELARAIFGIDRVSGGSIVLDGKAFRPRHPGDAISAGIAYVPEDRKKSGLILNFRLFSNVSLPTLRRFVRGGRVVRDLEISAFSRWARDLNIRAHTPSQTAQSLSGGNQQKVVLAKWLEASPRLLILDEPTRGVDVGAKTEIYAIINRLARAGTAILMISSDLPEVLGMSDRIVVMHEGRVTGEFDREQASEERVMQAAIA
jgi:ABC-type sugar transport system ATPase subunit